MRQVRRGNVKIETDIATNTQRLMRKNKQGMWISY